MEKQYRYLINNEVFGSDTEMPESNLDKFSKLIHPNVSVEHLHWINSLVKLECSRDEEMKILIHLSTNGYGREIMFNNPTIDITSITTVKDGKVSFKEEEGERQEDLLNDLISYYTHEMRDEILTKFTITRK